MGGHLLVAAARELAPAVRQRAPLAEEMRRLPDETVKECQEADLFRALQPARFGGLEADPADFFDAVVEIGKACGSTAWVLAVVAVHSWQLGLFPAEAQDEVWGEDSAALIASSYAPTGSVRPVERGYVLSGRWTFSSGCDHAGWVFLGGVVPRDEPGGPPDMRTFLVPASDYTIDDTWHVAGLAGSGSKDVVVDDAFVPEHRTHRFADVLAVSSPGNEVNPAPLFKLPFGGVFCYAIAVPALGVALGAAEAFLDQSRTRVMADRAKAADDPFTQLRLAEVPASLDAVYLQMRHNFAEMMGLARRGGKPDLVRRARYRWDACRLTRVATEAVDSMFEASGGRALFLDQPLQRAFRDLHGMRAHANNNPERTAQVYARAVLGFPNREFLL